MDSPLLTTLRRDDEAALRARLTNPKPPGATVTLQYVDASTRYVWTPITDTLLWARWQMNLLATGLWALGTVRAYSVLKGWSDRDVSITYTPAWSQGASAGSLNNTWSYTQVAGHYAEFAVTPTADGRVYLCVGLLSNAGYASVTIDGGTDLVNELPLVSGVRQLDLYGAAGLKNQRVLIASGLSVAAHTVRITALGTNNPASSGAYVWLEGYGITPLTLDDPQIVLAYDRIFRLTIGYATSNSNEYAYSIRPAGATGYEWTGVEHANEVYSSVAWEDDESTDITVDAEDSYTSGEEVIITQEGVTRHSETGATDHANVTCVHRFTTAGLDIAHTHEWLTAGESDFALTAMWRLVEAASAKAHIPGAGAFLDLTVNDDRDAGKLKKMTVATWPAGGNFVAWLYLNDALAGVNRWNNSVDGLFVLDEAAGTANKIYAQRVGTNTAIAPGDVWEGVTAYRIGYAPSPEAIMR